MNREIKFRGLRKDGNGWVFGDLVTGKYPVFLSVEIPAIMDANGIWPLIPETVGQYTGLNDNNGVEVYEDDNVLFTWFSYGEYELESHYEGSVEFINGSFMFCCQHGNYPFSELEFDSESDLEVIGNIHEKGN